MATGVTKPHGRAVDKQNSCENAKAAMVKAERRRWHDNNKCFICGRQGHTQWGCSQSQQGESGKGVHDQSHGQTPAQQQQSTNGPA